MRTKLKVEGSVFLAKKGLEYFRTFAMKLRGKVEDYDYFNVICNSIRKEDLVRILETRIPSHQIAKVEDKKDGKIDRCDLESSIMARYWNAPGCREVVRQILFELVADLQKKLAKPFKRRDVVAERFQEMCRFFHLTKLEADILFLSYLLGRRILEDPERGRAVREYMKVNRIALWLGQPSFLIRAAVADREKLRKYNCLDNDLDFNDELCGFLHGINNEPLSSAYYAPCKDKPLPWNFHAGIIKKHGAVLRDLIAKRGAKRGLNILLYGCPGTGKTSFARSLAAELGVTCYGIAQNVQSKSGDRSCSAPEFRFGALQICDMQVDPANSMIVIDEADEMLRGRYGGDGLLALLGGGGSTAGDKGMLNSLLDEIRVPCIWISNTAAHELDPSSRRRFDYSIRFDKLTGVQRLAIWQNNVEKYKLRRLFPSALQEKFADKYEVSAGGISLALRNVANLKPKAGECEKLVEKLLAPHCELLGIQTDKSKLQPTADYSLEGLNIQGEISPERMVEAVRRFQAESKDGSNGAIDRPRMNLLLSGAPGTGKTEFVKYLGVALKTKIVVKMGGDILSMYVGGTEQNIKRAFEEAEAEKAILFFDEIDGMLQSREQAKQSWEVTQVNELLHRMENFNGVMIGATNFTANLDPAVSRRFTFKLEFRYLDKEGKRLFFERMFKSALTSQDSARLEGIPDLAPGDFRTVRQGLHYLGGGATNAEWLAALERESQAKGQNRYSTKRIGF